MLSFILLGVLIYDILQVFLTRWTNTIFILHFMVFSWSFLFWISLELIALRLSESSKLFHISPTVPGLITEEFKIHLDSLVGDNLLSLFSLCMSYFYPHSVSLVSDWSHNLPLILFDVSVLECGLHDNFSSLYFSY